MSNAHIYMSKGKCLAIRSSIYNPVRDIAARFIFSPQWFKSKTGEHFFYFSQDINLEKVKLLAEALIVNRVKVTIDQSLDISPHPPQIYKPHQSIYKYVVENHVPLPKEKSLSQRQLQCLIRQHPDEALDFILNTEDEKHLDYIVFGDWHVDEVQTFNRDGWELCMRGYGLELPNIKDDQKFMVHCLPILYKKAREYQKQNIFNIFASNLKSVLTE